MTITTTDQLLKQLMQARNKQELDHILQAQTDPLLSFSAYYTYLMQQKNITTVEIFKKVNIERTYVYQILRGVRNPGRNKIIALAAAIHCTVEETQRLLTLAGKSQLYSKNPRDAVIIYGFSKGYDPEMINTLLFEKEMELVQ